MVMATVKELLTNVANNTRKFLGTEEQLSLEEMSQGIGEASAESDFQTELIEEFSTILDRSVAPDNYVNGKEDGYAEGVRQADALIERTLTEVHSGAASVGTTAFYNYMTLRSVVLPNATRIGASAFSDCSNLVNVSLPNVTDMGDSVFRYCSKLKSISLPKMTRIPEDMCYECKGLVSVDLPNVTSIADYAFNNCTSLASVTLPNVTTINTVFGSCVALKSADLPKATTINRAAFSSCATLKAVILRSETLCNLTRTDAFSYCYHILGTKNNTYNPNADKDGYFYVPRALLSDDDITKDYRRATNWATYADRFRALEDYTVDGTITGVLDPNKI
jgi:hypothetical protein